MTVLTHRFRVQFGKRDPHKKLTSLLVDRLPTLTERFMAFRRAAHAADESVDTFMKRGETTRRFAYFDN